MTIGELLGTDRVGRPIYDSVPSHLDAHRGVRAYLAAALKQISVFDRPRKRYVVSFDRIIGLDSLLKLEPGDSVFYQRRKGRTGLSKLVNRPRIPTKQLVVVILYQEERHILESAYFGTPVELEPTDPRFQDPALKIVMRRSIRQWADKALSSEGLELEGEPTDVCPWEE